MTSLSRILYLHEIQLFENPFLLIVYYQKTYQAALSIFDFEFFQVLKSYNDTAL